MVLIAIVAVICAGPAAAAKSCGDRVINDWHADGRVDGTYDLHCYDDAIEALSRDVKDYSSAEEDIQRAMQARLREGDVPAPTTGSNDDDDPGKSGPTDRTETDEEDTTGPGLEPVDPGPEPEAVPTLDTAASDSIPVPLLVLAGLALLLVAAGSLGYLVRRLQARRVPPAPL